MADLKAIGWAEKREIACARVRRLTLGRGEVEQREEQSTERILGGQQSVPSGTEVGGGDAGGERHGDEHVASGASNRSVQSMAWIGWHSGECAVKTVS